MTNTHALQSALAVVKPGIEDALTIITTQADLFFIAPKTNADALALLVAECKRIAGVFQMVDMPGLAVYCKELELSCIDLANNPAQSSVLHRETFNEAMQNLRDYLSEIEQGGANATLRLFAPYEKLQQLRGLESSFELDLFFPLLTVSLPSTASIAASHDDVVSACKTARAEYQQGLARYLRQLDAPAALATMQHALHSVMLALPVTERAYWWVAQGFCDCVSANDVAGEIQAKRVLGRLDQNLRALIEQRAVEAQPELAQMLYTIGRARNNLSMDCEAIKTAYSLADYLPNTHTLAPAQLTKRLVVISEALIKAEESLEHIAAHDNDSVAVFHAQTKLVSQYCQLLEHSNVKLLAQEMADYAARYSALDEEAPLALALAVTMLSLQRAVRDYRRLDSGFAEQTTLMIRSLALGAQRNYLDDAEAKRFGDLSSHTLASEAWQPLIKALNTNLHVVETALTSLFEDNAQRADLAKLPALLAQINGAISIVGEPAAMQVSQSLHHALLTLASSTHSLDALQSRDLAYAVSSLEQYILALPDATHLQLDALQLAAQNLQAHLITPNNPAAPAALDASVIIAFNADTDLLEIFLEEADEVMAILQENLELSVLHPSTQSYLVTIRRGFHTLKGSGRMVGLADLGEVAWNVERALNVWLKEERTLNEDVHAMIKLAITRFTDWVKQLQKTGRAEIDADELNQLARHIEQPNTLLAQPVPLIVASADTVLAAEVNRDETLPSSLATPSEQTILPSVAPRADELATPALAAITLAASVAASSNENANEGVMQTSENLELELLEIFLEEADEILLNLNSYLAQVKQNPSDTSVFVNIRRSFHTLKGSGRMVGLTKLGEVGWNVERAMNSWLKREDPNAPPVIKMVSLATEKFTVWIDSIKQNGAARITAYNLNQLANAIEHGTAIPAEVEANADASAQTAVPTPQADATQATPLATPVAPAAEELVQVGAIAVPASLFAIGSEESKQNVVKLRAQLTALRAADVPKIEYDFMRAAHTLVGVNRAMGFAPIVSLAAAFESWLLIRMEHPFELHATQAELLDNSINALAHMVDQVCEKHAPTAAPELIQALTLNKDQLKAAPIAPSIAPVTAAPAMIAAAVPLKPVPVISAAVTALLNDVAEESNVKDDIDTQLLPIFLEEADDLVPKIGDCLRAWRAQPDDRETLQLLNRLLHTAKGSARMAGAMRIGDVAHKMEDKVLAVGALKNDGQYWEKLDFDFDRINTLLEELRTGKVVPATPTVGSRSSDVQPSTDNNDKRGLEIGAERAMQGNLIRVRLDVVDRLVNEASEISVTRSRMEASLVSFKDNLLELTGSLARLRTQLREVEIQAESQMQARTSLINDSAAAFDPLEFDRFTRLQELTRFMNESVHDIQTVQQTLLKNLDETSAAMSAQARLNKDLQQGLMNVRMVPFNSINDRLYRIVRQTSKDLNKRANLDLIGSDVEIDRSVLEKMTAPFEHLLRNAIAHGLEDEAQRKRALKPEFGNIRVKIAQENNEVVFTLSDDGAGLHFSALRSKAIEQGLLGHDDNSSDEQLSQLIFASGMSTAANVSEISGRGIGMDVVRSEVAALGGRIDVNSTAGVGTQFIIHLPLTLAVTQVLMVRCGDTHYAIPASMVAQVNQVKASDMAKLYSTQHIEWQGATYPLQYLPALLDSKQSHTAEQQARNTVLLLRSGATHMALHIEELIGNQEVVVKNIGPQLARLPGIAGATVRGDGSVVLILNPLQMLPRTAQQNTKIEVAIVDAKPLIMVVDDSLTVRKITSRILIARGYDVVTATDGVDALEKLTEQIPMVMLVDVEMPRMDGFELTKEVRRTSSYKHIPIIMITSRTGDKHRDHAMQIGVNAYLGKPYQDNDLMGRIAAFCEAATNPA
jgi:chemosensory pili system protein ChpA (sensor histidine kinase/response regulator)